jgi:hypothetical protein
MANNKDQDRMDFLRDLDKADFDVTDWEASFIDSQLKRTGEISFTPKQRECIDLMVSKYQDRIK